MDSELNYTPGKREGVGGGGREGGGEEGEDEVSSLPSFFFLREFFSRTLPSERLEQAT